MRPHNRFILRDARKGALLRMRGQRRRDLRRRQEDVACMARGRGRHLLRHTGAQVRKKLLGRLKEAGDSMVMPSVPPDERDMLVESQPKVFYFTDHYKDYPMVLIRLSKAKRASVEPLLRRQWRTLASKAAVREFDISHKQ